MKLTQWTLFIDMLGYRDMNGVIDDEEKAKEFIEFMELNKEIFELSDSEAVRKRYSEDSTFNLYEYYEIKTAFVSDSVIVTYYPKEVGSLKNVELANMHSANSLFIILIRLQTFIFNCFSQKGLFLRGGISNKYCYIQNSFAVGEGLIEAYVGESKLAVNPRIILHPEIEKNTGLMGKIEFLTDKMYSGNSIIKRDSDGIYFLDHLGYAVSTIDLSIPMMGHAALKNPVQYALNLSSVDSYVKRHAEAITEKLQSLNAKLEKLTPDSKEAEKTISVISKFLWLKNYHNSKIKENDLFCKYICM